MGNPQKLMRCAVMLCVLIAAGCATTTVTPIASSTALVTSLLPTPMPPTATSNPTTIVSPTAVSNPTAAPSPAATGSLVLSSLHMVSATSGWATGQSSNKNASGVFHTDDGGAHWRNVSPVNLPGNLPWAFFADASNAWLIVAGSAANDMVTLTTYHTTDGGQDWQSGITFSLSGGSGPGALDFIDAQHGWMMAGLGAAAGSEAVAILQTVDGGLHWQEVSRTNTSGQSAPGSLPFGCIKSGISFLDANTGWATGSCAGGALFFYATHDGGRTWQSQPLPAPAGYAANIFSQCMCSLNPPVFFGQTGVVAVQIYEQTQAVYLFVTRDSGKTWASRKLPINQPMGGLSFIDVDNGWVTDGNQVYSTHDGGQNWITVGRLPVAGNNLLGGLDFVSANDGWVAESMQLYATHDGGKTWTARAPNVSSSSLTVIIPTTGGTNGATSTPGPIGLGSIPLSNSPQPIKFAPGDYGIAMRGVGQVTLSVTILPLPVPLPANRAPLGFLPGEASTTFTVNLVQGEPQGYVFYVLQGQTTVTVYVPPL